MSQTTINKYGLKRYISQSIREVIRKEAGYGCVICGSMFCDYEHIEPEFHNAKEHNSEHMTLLCSGCHGKVTGRRISKKKVWEAKKNPFALKYGHVKENIELVDSQSILLGDCKFDLTSIVLLVYGKPLLWFEKGTNDEPILINAIFYDDKNHPIAYINRNQFIGNLTGCDIKSEGVRIEIRPKKGMIALILNIEANKLLSIERMKMKYLESGVEINNNKEIKVINGMSNFTLGSGSISNCGIGFCISSPPETSTKVKKILMAFNVKMNGINIIDAFGKHVGWLVGATILNKRYNVVAIVKENDEVISIVGEYIGNRKGNNNSIRIESDGIEYKTYEPIWIHPKIKSARNIFLSGGIDVTPRLFGNFL